MRLSALQRYILRDSYLQRRDRVPRQPFLKFYRTAKPRHMMVETVTKSLERLIDRGLMIGYGRRTPKKWFIDEVALTPLGRGTARKLLGQQQKLPFL
ncbi:MAG: hypothetical protein HYY50_01965 [Candidatus Kerfeldbacteria bacterium]|nr:hypothetical protein [Candidatus Kerfeldbacteria bacterium]